MLTIDVTGLQEWREKLDPRVFRRAVEVGMDRGAARSVGYIQARKLSQKGPDTLGIQSQHLRGSLTHTQPKVGGNSVSTLIGTRVEYGAVHEYGAKAYTIRPKEKKALAFTIGGRKIVRKFVKHKAIPARRWLSKGVAESGHFFTEEIRDEILEELNK